MTPVTWHPADSALASYATNRMPASQVWSIEAHVAACADCRRTLGGLVDSTRLDVIWDATLEGVDAPRPRLVERGLTAAGVPDHVARLLGATPSLTVPWMAAVVAVLGFGLVMAWRSAGGSPLDARAGLFPFLVLAQLVPLAGVAVAFGPVVDPAHEVAVASPYHGFRLLLVRTVAVVTASTVLALVLALLLPDAGLLGAAWILPGLALAVTALAVSTFADPLTAGVAVAVVWLVGVTVVEAGPEPLVAFGWSGQLLFALVVAVAILVVVARRQAFEIGTRR